MIVLAGFPMDLNSIHFRLKKPELNLRGKSLVRNVWFENVIINLQSKNTKER